MRVGCGWGRLCALRQEDLRLETASVQVRGKGDKERIVPIGRSAVEALEAYVARGRPGLVKRRRGCSGRCFFRCGESR